MNVKKCLLALSLLATVLAQGADGKSFVVKAKVDLRNVTADERLVSADGINVVLRMAPGKGLEDYDLKRGNYLQFKMPDGTCPVIEATIGDNAWRVGVPLACLAQESRPASEVILSWQPPRWSIMVDGCVDEEFPHNAGSVAWKGDETLQVWSRRVKDCVFRPDAPETVPEVDVGPIAKPIQYWTPKHHNTWVGDVAPGTIDGKLHVFYLIDRRHHGSGGGAGRHQFAHLVSSDLKTWEQLPLAVPIRKWWETCGTGTPFKKGSDLALAFGWHSDRFEKGHPLGATYATAADGVHFTNSGVMINDCQNPSIYNLADGSYELVTSYGGTIGIYRSTDLLDWKLYDAKLPFRGDCPSLFDWHGHRYLLQGFNRYAYNADGSVGGFVDWTNEADELYEGLSVPMVVPWQGERRLYIGWLRHLYGWGGWLVFRELVYYPDGHLGMKWIPEIATPVVPEEISGVSGRLIVKYQSTDGRIVSLTVDPATKEASWGDGVGQTSFGQRYEAGNVKIGGVRGIEGAYGVKVVNYYDAKADATVFDAEIAGQRTLICRRLGKFERIK